MRETDKMLEPRRLLSNNPFVLMGKHSDPVSAYQDWLACNLKTHALWARVIPVALSEDCIIESQGFSREPGIQYMDLFSLHRDALQKLRKK